MIKLKEINNKQLLRCIIVNRSPRQNLYFTIKNNEPAGLYGRYIKLSNSIGIKISHTGFKSKKALLENDVWNEAKKEYKNILEAKKRLKSAAPHGKKVFAVQIKSTDTRWNSKTNKYESIEFIEWRAAIAMEHIEGVHDIYCKNIVKARKLLDKANISHIDLHGYNIILRTNKPKNRSALVIIDWDSRTAKMK